MEDKKKVWDKRVWNFDGSLMVLKEFDPKADSRRYNLIIASFWIQMHGIPKKLMFTDNIYSKNS